MTGKQQEFCNAYVLNGFNGAEAARTAGYSHKSAGIIAAQNLRKPNIRAEIARLKAANGKQYDFERFLKECHEIKDAAVQRGDTHGMVEAERLIGRACGYIR